MARYRPKGLGLERVLGVGALFSTAYGNVGSSIYYALGVVAVFALGMTPVVYLIAGLIFVMTAMTYTEAATNFPEAGGSSSFARRAFNELVSFLAAWGQMLNYVITVAISAFFVPHYLGVFWEPLKDSPGDIIGGIVIVIVLSAINIIGVRESARLNLILAIVDFATQIFLVLLGIVLVLNFTTLIENVHLWQAPTFTNFALAITVAMISYTGIETISNMSEEVRDPRRLVPRAMRYVVLAVLVISATIPAVALSAMPVTESGGEYSTELATTFAGDPILGIVENMQLGIFATPMEYYVGILAATILLVATNAGIIGVSRLTYSMGQYQQLPDRLRQISPRFRTPAAGIAIFGLVACLVIIPGQADFLGTLYTFGAMLSFTIAHLALIGLRWRLARSQMRKLAGDVVEETEEAWYRAPFNMRWHGVDVPLFAVFGGIGTSIAFVVTVLLHPEVAAAGFGWLVVGIVIYVAYRRHQGLDLVSTYKVAIPQPVVDHEAEYDSVLVPLGDGSYDERVVATATKLAARRRRGIHVLALVTVPHALPIDAALPEAESSAASMIEQAKIQGGRRVSGHVEKIRAGQAGRRIIEEAVDMRAAAIVMPLPQRIDGASLFGKTLETVLAERPCRVIIESVPEPVQ